MTTYLIDHFASEQMGYQNAIIYEDVQDWSRFGFRKLKASCLPIPQKKLQWIGLQDSYSAADTSTWSDADYAGLIKLDGENYYKSIYAALNHDHKLYALKLMKPYFINAKSIIDDEMNCQVRHCSHICNGVTVEEQANYPILHLIPVSKNVYMYARGCSPSTVFDVILKKTQIGELITSKLLDVLKQTTTKAELETWEILHSGECVRCKDCGNGQYNPYCNKYGYLDDSSQLILPDGKCFLCLTECPQNYYLDHPLRFAGCERFAVPGLFDNVHNYQCKKCPTLIFIDSERTATLSHLHPDPLPQFSGLYIVAGCGEENSGYEHFETSVTGTHFYTSVSVTDDSFVTSLNEQTREFKKYLPFHKLLPVCPPLHFYDVQLDGCGLEEATSVIVDGLKLYFNKYQGFDASTNEAKCCKPCNTCGIGDGLKRDMKNWQQCSGSSITDSQAYCTERCSTGSFESKNNTCELCTTCAGDAMLR